MCVLFCTMKTLIPVWRLQNILLEEFVVSCVWSLYAYQCVGTVLFSITIGLAPQIPAMRAFIEKFTDSSRMNWDIQAKKSYNSYALFYNLLGRATDGTFGARRTWTFQVGL